ncbi:MAG: DUF1127 domain-containing protein [Geminicoccaceae bacterium]
MTSLRLGASYATLAGGTSIHRPAGSALWTQVVEVLLTWVERTRQRRQLGQLSAHMLKDIGLSRADVEIEMSKPFWRA